MLPRPARLRTAAEFTQVLRAGRRGSASTLVAYRLMVAPSAHRRAGLVVSKKVGNSVVRHRVARRLRAILAQQLPLQPEGSRLVVRALPAAADASSAVLAADLDQAMAAIDRRRRT